MEALNAIKNMQNDKSPGPGGFIKKFYKCNWKYISYFWLMSTNEGFERGFLSSA